MSQTLENPYDQATQPKEYQAWYYQNVIKPQREAKKPQKEPEYYKNRQKYTTKQLKFNRMTRLELIDEIYTPKDEIDPETYMTYKTKSGNIIERTKAQAVEKANQEIKNYHESLKNDPRANRIIDFIDIIMRNPNYTPTEAYTLLELTFRYLIFREDMAYYWIKPPELTTDDELEALIPRRTILTIIPNIEEALDDTTNAEQTLWDNMKIALDKLRSDWRSATDEAQTPLTHKHTPNEGKTIIYNRQSALLDLQWSLNKTLIGETAEKHGFYNIETLPPIPI